MKLLSAKSITFFKKARKLMIHLLDLVKKG